MFKNIDVHLEVLERKSSPYWIFLLGIIMALIFTYIFPKIIQKIDGFQIIEGSYLLHSLIEYYLKELYWIYYGGVFLIFIYFYYKAHQSHKLNYEKIIGRGSWD